MNTRLTQRGAIIANIVFVLLLDIALFLLMSLFASFILWDWQWITDTVIGRSLYLGAFVALWIAAYRDPPAQEGDRLW